MAPAVASAWTAASWLAQSLLAAGLVDEYLPRRHDFRRLTQADLDTIAQELNVRPRQTLGFKTPSQALAEVLR